MWAFKNVHIFFSQAVDFLSLIVYQSIEKYDFGGLLKTLQENTFLRHRIK